MNSVRVEQVGEAVGLEHDGDDVRRVGLVELDQALGERRAATQQPAAQPGRAGRARGAACAWMRGELGALGVEVVCS